MSIRTLHTATQALKAQSTRFSSVSENIANLNTTGYKRSAIHFSEAVSGAENQVSPAGFNGGGNTAPTSHAANFGGITSKSTRNYLSDGQFSRTGEKLDLAIDGNSQFIVREYIGDDLSTGGETFLTSAGNFQVRPFYANGTKTLENQGIYLSDQNGHNVMGQLYNEATGLFETTTGIDSLSPIRFAKAAAQEAFPAIATTQLTASGLLSSDTDVGGSVNLASNIYTGNGEVNEAGTGVDTSIVDVIPMSLNFEKISSNLWGLVFSNSQLVNGQTVPDLAVADIPYGDEQPVALVQSDAVQKELGWRVQFDGEGKPLRAWNGGGNFPPAGAEVVTDFTKLNFSIIVTAPNPDQRLPDPDNPGQILRDPALPKYIEQDMEINIDLRNLLSYGGDNSVLLTPNGRSVGTRQFRDLTVENNGIVYRNFDDGSKIPLAKMVAGIARSLNGLDAVSGTLARIGGNAGDISVLTLGTGSSQGLMVGMLEASNVDLAESFSQMIINQRAYGMNTKTLTTAIEMSERAISLKK